MSQHRERRFVPHAPERMYDLVAAVEAYPAFLPWCRGARVLARSEGALTADLTVGYKLFQETFRSDVALQRPGRIEIRYSGGPLHKLESLWLFEGEGKGCWIDFSVDFALKSPFLERMMDQFFDHAFKKMVAAFETRASELYGEE